MKKYLVILMAVAMLFAMTSLAFAAQDPGGAKGNITANEYTFGADWNDGNGNTMAIGAKDWSYKEQGTAVTSGSYTGAQGFASSTHVYGTWNSPYTYGIDGYNYNDAQDYTDTGAQVGVGQHVYYPANGAFITAFTNMGMPLVTIPSGQLYEGQKGVETTLTSTFTSGPHGGYLTSTHRCRECHAVHRAAGKFKLLRSDTRFEACDWCHGTGAGSGFNIQMDNDDNYTTEYNVGHTMGFGISSGKWKAPDDTYPAFTPNYWMGGFSCFDCHSPHANPARIMGYDQNGKPIQSIVKLETGEVYNMGNPGHDLGDAGGSGFADAESGDGTYWVPALGGPLPKSKPYYLAGSWLLIKNPDREIAQTTETVNGIKVYQQLSNMTQEPNTWVDGHYVGGRDSGMYWGDLVQDNTNTITLNPGDEILDNVDQVLNEFSTNTAYPVNKQPTDWNDPIGSASIQDFTNMLGFAAPSSDYGNNVRNPFCKSLIADEFCTDCHDGNGGLHTVQAPLFSEDRALRNQTVTSNNAATDTATSDSTNWKGSYDLAYGHDAAVRH
ncbi:MAG: hypothetical protein COW32_01100 [Candidatus Aquicultor secundus]|nr:MAG: hypothetical protein COW32_01100 [Candidatus Aquicultor secundus]